MREIRFHDLRHTCATLLLTKGVHPKVVSEMLGHANISITLNTYSHVIRACRTDAAANAMEDVLSKSLRSGRLAPRFLPRYWSLADL